ncbi:MAG: phosphoribosyltransferase family protein [Campylobacterota bacterium]|nr:phosphoribosyltransferase family protein [Campylobacterota bacterium]
MFKNRKDAGIKLAEALHEHKDTGVLVLAIPRGGVELGYEVAKALDAGFSLLVCRKLPYPFNPESGFGAIAEDGSLYINRAATASVSDDMMEEIILRQREEIKRRIDTLRDGQPLPEIKGHTVILIDDGIAMGSTMHAAVELCRKQDAAKIIVAVPVAGHHAIQEFGRIADEIVVLESPVNFYAVAQVYENWYDVSDEEALEIYHRPRQ